MHRFAPWMMLLLLGCTADRDGFGTSPPSNDDDSTVANDDDATSDDDDAAVSWSNEDVFNVLFAIEDLRSVVLDQRFALLEVNQGLDPDCPQVTSEGDVVTYTAPVDGCQQLSTSTRFFGEIQEVDEGQSVTYEGDGWRVELFPSDRPELAFTGTWTSERFPGFPDSTFYTNSDTAEGEVLNTFAAAENSVFEDVIQLHQYDWWRTEQMGVEEIHHYDVDATLPIYGNVMGWYRYTADYSCLYDNNPEEPVPLTVEFQLQTESGLLESLPLKPDGSCQKQAAWRLGDQEGVVSLDDH